MENFDFYNPTRIIFGKNTHLEIGNLLKPHAKKVLLHYGGQSVKKSGVFDQVVASLRNAGVDFVELDGVVPNPRVTLVREGIQLCKENKVDLILAVGGGSVIDSAKAISMGIFYEGDVWDIYAKHLPVSKNIPVATILTIPAAGSESSPSSVISNDEVKLKKGYTNNITRPLLSVINPELFFSLPKNQIANGVSDMMSHIFERYFTRTLHTDLTDALCEATLRTIMRNALILMNDPANYDAWCEVGFSGNVAHNDMLGLGRAQDWACHGMEHELSALYDVAHGAGLAVLTPAWMKYVYKENMNMFVQFAVNVMGVNASFRDPEYIVTEGIRLLSEFYRKLGLPQTLGELFIGNDQLELMAKKATGEISGNEHKLGGMKRLGWQDVLAIYKMAL
ncbi:MAG: iron-containing alcohol dehydrogenase [Fibrobacter sp.]|jgi:alcohol dehydrogenase YqhD (iron-dependent ADH family)|nr:iron-containing alcohol dehydrogenase [Fibrobacter sp.]